MEPSRRRRGARRRSPFWSWAVRARFTNSGQSCLCAKRFIASEAVADAVTEAFVRGVEHLRIGDPPDRSTQIGPLARDGLRAAIIRQVEESARRGRVS